MTDRPSGLWWAVFTGPAVMLSIMVVLLVAALVFPPDPLLQIGFALPVGLICANAVSTAMLRKAGTPPPKGLMAVMHGVSVGGMLAASMGGYVTPGEAFFLALVLLTVGHLVAWRLLRSEGRV